MWQNSVVRNGYGATQIPNAQNKGVEIWQWPNWWSFVKYVEERDNFDYIFRGHSNYLKPSNQFNRWPIISSFNRSISKQDPFIDSEAFRTIIDYFNKQLTIYKAGCINFNPEDIKIIERLQFLQHYITGTPLLDFTKDPLVALYFASTGLHSEVKNEMGFHNENRYVTIISLNMEKIKSIGVEIFNNKKDYFSSYLDGTGTVNNATDDFKYYYRHEYQKNKFVIRLVNCPNQIINPNVRLQEGLFLYYDSMISLEKTINSLAQSNRRENETFITLHDIPYKTLFRIPENNCINIYAYLMRKNKIGINLFENDKEGLKMDWYNNAIVEALGCLNNQDYSTCSCMKTLRDECGLKL